MLLDFPSTLRETAALCNIRLSPVFRTRGIMDQRILDGGEAILQGVRDLGIEYLFSSPGSDWGSLWEALARQKVSGTPGPTYLSCGHETLAVDLAVGYTMMTGRMQGVVLHAGVGLMQGAVGIHGARLNEIPMVIFSGESMTFGDDESFDPGAQWYGNHNNMGGLPRLIDPLVKWGHQATSVHNVYEMVVRAGEMASQSPLGPTYIDVPIEVMMTRWPQPAKLRKVPKPPSLRPSNQDIEKAAQMLLEAKNPVITAQAAGRSREGYEALVELADLLAIAVVETGEATNFPKDHPLYQGTTTSAFLKDADLAIAVRSRNPWYPPNMGPLNAKVIIIDDAPLKMHMAYQNLQTDLFLGGDPVASMRLLTEALKASKIDAGKVKERRAKWTAAHDRREQKLRAAEAEAKSKPGIHSIALAATLAEALPENTIYLDETTVHGGTNKTHVRSKGPQSYISPRSGLGQGMGIACGVKLARKDQPVTLLIGDGAFLYNPSVQALGFARDEKLPFMAVVYNNKGYRAMRSNQQSYYPDGAGAKHGLWLGEPTNEFAYQDLAPLFGGAGYKVQELKDLKPTLQKASEAVASGKSAIVNVVLSD
jgi:acetolactate synthase-1/2/3 large subunit